MDNATENTPKLLAGRCHFHFIGAGGSGMYPLIQITRRLCPNALITGSDNNETETVAAVRKMGIEVYFGQRGENIGDADCVVYSAAIASDNPELVRAHEVCGGIGGRVLLERSELLGLITAAHPVSVCVCGTHGKTTCTSMLTHIVLAAGVDTSALIGGKIKITAEAAATAEAAHITTAGLYGSSGVMVTEACEFADTFLKLKNDISVVLNIDNDHMDYFKTLDNLINSFTRFIDGNSDYLIINGDDVNTQKAVELSKFNKNNVKIDKFYAQKPNDTRSLLKDCRAVWYPENITRLSKTESEFTIVQMVENESGGVTRYNYGVKIRVPGAHNIGNAVAAAAAAYHIEGVTPAAITAGLDNFTGVARRFEFCGRLTVGDFADSGYADVVDDYAHHPAEVTALLKTAKDMGYNRVIAVHQPFTYSRTFNLLREFAGALAIADLVILTDIMGGREVNECGVRTEDLAALLTNAVHCPTFGDAEAEVRRIARGGDLVLTFGCGDVYKVARELVG